MNLQEARVLFIAQHHGQKCVISGNEFTIQGHIIDGVFNGIDCYIPLRSVDKLTDEETETLAELIYGNSFEKEDGHITRLYQLASISQWLSKLSELREQLFMCVAIYQHLLRIGILLPFTYLNEDNKPVTLEPSEIIALGWAKYKK